MRQAMGTASSRCDGRDANCARPNDHFSQNARCFYRELELVILLNMAKMMLTLEQEQNYSSTQRHAPAALPRGKDPVQIVKEIGRAPGLVLTGEEDLVRTGIRFPDRPARSKSLYRLRYPDPLTKYDIPDRDTLPSLLAYIYIYIYIYIFAK